MLLQMAKFQNKLIADGYCDKRGAGFCATATKLPKGEYGIEDVCIGLPSIIGYGGVKRVLEIPLDRTERAFLKKSADALKKVICSLDESEILVWVSNFDLSMC